MHFDRDTKIAFLGMGLMGTRMATRLVQAGFEVAVWNRSPAACEPVLSLEAKPLQLTEIGQYPVILSCLADDHAVKPFLIKSSHISLLNKSLTIFPVCLSIKPKS